MHSRLLDAPRERVFAAIQDPARVVIEHLSAGHHFLLTIELEAQGECSRVGWRQLLDTAEHRARIAPIVQQAKEQNLDRLSAEVALCN